MMSRGRYIIYEGGEGAGKFTQIRHQEQRLIELGVPAISVREPGGTPFGDALRGILLGTEEELGPDDEFFTFCASRSRLVKVIDGYLQQGTTVLSDRGFLSSIAYQCYGSGLSLGFAEMVTRFIMRNTPPDLILVFDVDFEIGMQRRLGRNATDRFEQRDIEFHLRVKNGFLAEARKRGLPVIDANQSFDDIASEIESYIDPLIKEYIHEPANNTK